MSILLSLYSDLLPLMDELGTGSNAFLKAASGRRTITALANALLALCYFADVPLKLMNLFNEQRSIIKPTDLPPDVLRRILSSTRMGLSLPGQLKKIFTYLNMPHITGIVLSSNLCDIMSFSMAYATAFAKFRLNFGDALHTSAPHRRKLLNLFTSSLDLSLLADILEVTGDLLEASLTGRLPATPRPAALKMYSATISEALLVIEQSGPTPFTQFCDRLMSSGTWATPFFTGIEQLVISCEEGDGDPLQQCSEFVIMANILTMPMYANSLDPNWRARAKTATVIAKPQFLKVAMDVLDRVEKWLATAPGVEQAMRLSGMMLPMLGYGLLIEANRANAQLVEVPFNWVPIARAISIIGDLWVKLAGAPPAARERLLATASSLVSRSSMSLVSDIVDTPTISKVSIEDVVPLLRAVERVATILATGPQFLTSLNAEEFEMPIGPPVFLAKALSERCFECLEGRKEELRGGPLIREMGAAALAALETAGKATRLLMNMPEEIREVFMPYPDFLTDSEEEETETDDEVPEAWWIGRLTDVLASLLKILDICREVGGPEGEQQAACAVLTVGEDFLGIEDFLCYVEYMSMHTHMTLKARSQEILSRCIVPSDYDSMHIKEQDMYEVAEGVDEIIKNLCKVAKGADRRDPERMKLRAQVLGHRSCACLDCCTLRPSSEKPFGKLCAGCKVVRYCCVEHQKKDWKKGHKIGCKELQKS